MGLIAKVAMTFIQLLNSENNIIANISKASKYFRTFERKKTKTKYSVVTI